MQWDGVSLRPVTSCCLRACALSQAWRRVTLPFLTCVFVCVVPFFSLCVVCFPCNSRVPSTHRYLSWAEEAWEERNKERNKAFFTLSFELFSPTARFPPQTRTPMARVAIDALS